MIERALALARFALWLLRVAGRALRHVFWLAVLAVLARRAWRHRRGQRLYWGPDPIINVKYFSDALRGAGFDTTTLVSHDYGNFKAQRFDLYHDEVLARSRWPGWLKAGAREYIVFLHLLRSYDIAHLSFAGGPLGRTPLAWVEPHLLRWAGIRTVMIPYGGDFLRYSWMSESLVRHAVLLNYPDAGRNEDRVERQVKRWMRHADIVVSGFMIEGASRWDVIVTNFVVVPANRVVPRASWGAADGRSAPVKIVHAPNHRGVKGTEFLLMAIEALRGRGYLIDLVLLENTPNEIVLEHMRSADICFEHCIGSGYALFAIEAMGSGAVVLSNLEDEQRIGVHRHFGWLNQCPIVSANIEQLESTLEYLIRNPALREQLGGAGIRYVRRFHSEAMALHLFGSIYRKLAGEELDLLRLFQPSSSEFMKRQGTETLPLRRNRPLARAGAASVPDQEGARR